MPQIVNGRTVYQAGEALPVVGSQEYLNAQRGILPSSAPTSADQIKPTPSLKFPQPKTTLADTTDASAFLAGSREGTKIEQDIRKQQEARLASLKTATEGSKSWLDNIMAPKESKSQVREGALNDIGFEMSDYLKSKMKIEAESSKLEDEYNKEKQKMEEAIARIEENSVGVFGGVISDEVARVERAYSTRLNRISANIKTKAAQVAALDGNYELALDYANQAVQDEMADRQDEIDNYKLLREYNMDIWQNMDSIYKDAFDASIAEKERQYAEEFDLRMMNAKNNAGLPGEAELMEPGFELVEPENLKLVEYLKQYKDIIDSTSFTGLQFSPKKKGEANSLLALITAEYKQAKKLGTLDAGVQNLMDRLVGKAGIGRISNKIQSAAVGKALQSFGFQNITIAPDGTEVEITD